jgi:protoporphyrinogen oxidase
MPQNTRIVIIGAGPTGLAAAYRLQELGYQNWALYEKAGYVGGHSCSHVDSHGFVWDEGGHVIFSHYPYFDRLVDDMLGTDESHLLRESWIVKQDNWIPYPFQNNLRYLPKSEQISCLMGAAHASLNGKGRHCDNFREWILATFGQGIAEAFMFPYNLKVWTTPLELMSKSWIAERVSVLDFRRLLENILYERDDVGWGPNNRFRFPLHGGTGEIYRRMASRFPAKIRTEKELAEVNSERHTISFTDGTGDTYDHLISTVPVDLLSRMVRPVNNELVDSAGNLKHNSLLVIGLGLMKKMDTHKCWVYFADAEMPCYRATYFSHYSPFNVPNGDTGRYSSLMCEASFPVGQTPDPEALTNDVISGLIRAKMIAESDRKSIISRYHSFASYSYPIPTLDRDVALAVIQPELMRRSIYSRGRFGTWRYEIGNMDHSVMMGVEAVNHILAGDKESVFEGF